METPKPNPAHPVDLTRIVRRALTKACDAAMRHRAAESALAKLVEERYGIAPNAVDCDPFIDSVDYGHGQLVLEELDELMAEAGYPPNDKGQLRREENHE